LNNFHDKKRRIEYYRIAKIIEDENKKNPNKPPKGIVGDKPGMKTNESGDNNNNNSGGAGEGDNNENNNNNKEKSG
jgi:hypothetical protein